MSVYDKRLDALEKDVAVMKRDIIYKLDDTNSVLTTLKGILGSQDRDLKFLINQVKGIDIRLEGLEQEVRVIKEQQDEQGRNIRGLKRSSDEHFDVLENKFDQVLSLLATLTSKSSEE